MTQEPGYLGALRAELERAKRLRFSTYRLDCEAELPVDLATVYRWLKGGGEPGVRRLAATVAAIREFLDREQARVARGRNTHGGPFTLNVEFKYMTRDGVVEPLKGQEIGVLDAVMRARSHGGARTDWIMEQTGMSRSSLHRSVSYLKKKLRRLDMDLLLRPNADGGPKGYVLSEINMVEKGEAA